MQIKIVGAQHELFSARRYRSISQSQQQEPGAI